jgi:hypothetical protein
MDRFPPAVPEALPRYRTHIPSPRFVHFSKEETRSVVFLFINTSRTQKGETFVDFNWEVFVVCLSKLIKMEVRGSTKL